MASKHVVVAAILGVAVLVAVVLSMPRAEVGSEAREDVPVRRPADSGAATSRPAPGASAAADVRAREPTALRPDAPRRAPTRAGDAPEAAPVAVDPEQAQVHGLVVDGFGAPVAGAPVVLGIHHGRRAETDDEGRFAFVNLQPGHWELIVESPRGAGTAEAMGDVFPEDGQRLNVVVVLQAQGWVRGRARTAEGRASPGRRMLLTRRGLMPEPDTSAFLGADIIIRSEVEQEHDGTLRMQTRCDSRGAFAFGPLPPGEYVVQDPDGFAEERVVVVTPGGTVEVELIVGLLTSVEGALPLCAGTAAADLVSVQLLSFGDAPDDFAVRDQRVRTSSRFRFDDVSPGRHAVLAWVPGSPVPVGAAFAVTEGEALSVALPEFVAGPLRGRVVSKETGEPLAAARVSVDRCYRPPITGSEALVDLARTAWVRLLDHSPIVATTNDSGDFGFACLPAGEYDLRADHDDYLEAGYHGVTRRLRVTAGEPLPDLTFELERAAVVTVEIFVDKAITDREESSLGLELYAEARGGVFGWAQLMRPEAPSYAFDFPGLEHLEYDVRIVDMSTSPDDRWVVTRVLLDMRERTSAHVVLHVEEEDLKPRWAVPPRARVRRAARQVSLASRARPASRRGG